MEATVRFLHDIQELQLRWAWKAKESPVFDAMSWLQGLWASRTAVRPLSISPSIFLAEFLDPEYGRLEVDDRRRGGVKANRKQNSQNRSFIEQRMVLYAWTGCFANSKEVLRRDVEVVEYMNDLIDLFN